MLAFFSGVFLGGLVGVIAMCLLQVSRDRYDD